jgi:hypothetical protein
MVVALHAQRHLDQGPLVVHPPCRSKDGVEAEADAWAEEMLVGRERFEAFVTTCPSTKQEVAAFAEEGPEARPRRRVTSGGRDLVRPGEACLQVVEVAEGPPRGTRNV